ncbi:MAG: phosphoribosylanthranilate isomerase [Prevotellaceae bacterium]|jgi:phosphoribosylanthranilate isomerase|nr:phosphoribosylanthranilate isomerase [Prevotellaceae bacterium]
MKFTAKIKICGMKQPDNIRDVAELPIDMMGFIFYPASRRYVGNLDPNSLTLMPRRITKTGVFVNESENAILDLAKKYDLQAIQMHGNESPAACSRLKTCGYTVIKAFGLENFDDFEQTIPYENICDYFLFDAKTPIYGGSGFGYNWAILNHYDGMTPFFLSGGICADDADRIKELKHPQLYGIDLNSRFEIEPGLKNTQLLKSFLENLI